MPQSDVEFPIFAFHVEQQLSAVDNWLQLALGDMYLGGKKNNNSISNLFVKPSNQTARSPNHSLATKRTCMPNNCAWGLNKSNTFLFKSLKDGVFFWVGFTKPKIQH